MAVPSPIVLSDPKLHDLSVSGINTKLVARLPWITTAYGVAVKRANEKGMYPAFETTSRETEEYKSLLPDTDLGTYCYWDVTDGSKIERKGDFLVLQYTAGLVFWGDLRAVYPDPAWKDKNSRNVMYDVAQALRRQGFGTSQLQILKEWTESKNIYRGYYIQEVKQQHLMRPYFGFRIECEIFHKEFCT